jgi:phospholipid/cholesterol/gamma-HCH transport system substrate-binding protein
MAKKISQQVRVGIFVLLGLILSMTVIFLLGGGISILERQYTLKARFKDISGLRLGAPVFLAGIGVGKVDDIRFPRDLNEKDVIVYLKIKRTFEDRIREDSLASITTQGLLGDKAIFITVGTPQALVHKAGDELKVKQGLSMENLADEAQELLDNVNKLSKNANDIITDIKQQKGFLHAMIYETEGEDIIQDLSKITRSANGVMKQIQKGNGVLHALVYDPTTRDLGRLFSDTAQNFKSLSQHLDAVGEKVNKGEGSIGGLVNDPSVYYDLMTLLGKANRNKLLRTVIRATLATNEADLVGDKSK